MRILRFTSTIKHMHVTRGSGVIIDVWEVLCNIINDAANNIHSFAILKAKKFVYPDICIKLKLAFIKR